MPKIMIVDDEAAISMQLEERLAAMGYDVVGRADSGDQAIEMAEDVNPDLILMDIVMPGDLNGVGAAAMIKTQMDIPVVFMTAHAGKQLIGRAKQAEPFGYILKPFDERGLEATIEMALHKKEMEQRLQESEAKYRLLVETMSDGLAVFDHNHLSTYVNDRFCEMLGRSRDEIVGRPARDFLDETNQGISRQQVVKTKRGEMVPHELVWTRKDGRKLSTLVSPQPVLDAEGHFDGTFAVVTDIMELKQAEEQIRASLREKEVLLRELHHRVKNNMQVISSLLSLQAKNVREKKYADLLKVSQNRIECMALVHERLYQSQDLANIDFDAYAKSLARDLFRSYGIDPGRIALNTEAKGVSLALNEAVPCALIMNELVSNALKYAFPEERKGEIDIALTAIDGNKVELRVGDNGVGLPEGLDFRNTESLGLQIVTILAEGQLEGEIQLDRTEGTHYQIRFKGAKDKART